MTFGVILVKIPSPQSLLFFKLRIILNFFSTSKLLLLVEQRGVASLPEPARIVFDKGNRRLSRATILGMALAVLDASIKPSSSRAAAM